MPYPITWQPGEILGRNYVPHPKFSDGAAATAAALWTGGTTDTRDLGAANGGTQYRLSGSAAYNTVLSGLTFAEAAGKTYLVRVLAYATDATTQVAVAGGGGSVDPAYFPAGTWVSVPQSSGYVWHEIAVTVPATGYKNSVNAPTTNVADVRLYFKTGATTTLGIGKVRVDEQGSPLAGYFDGSDADTSTWDFAWTGTALRSASTATALTQYPAPTTTPNASPVASFTATSANLTVNVDASASDDPEDAALTYSWDFGDGSTATGVTASRTYAADGTYTITLTVSDGTNVAVATKTAAVSLTQDTDPVEPVPEDLPISELAADVVTFMGREGDTWLAGLAAQHVPIMAELVNAYVRGRGPIRTGLGLGEFNFPPDLRAVVITASARLLTNPAQLESESSDGYAARGSFSSFSLAEQAVLHRYRRRVA